MRPVWPIEAGVYDEEAEPRPVPLANLTLDARVLLLDSKNANQAKLERMLGEFEEEYIRNVGDAKVTGKSSR